MMKKWEGMNETIAGFKERLIKKWSQISTFYKIGFAIFLLFLLLFGVFFTTCQTTKLSIPEDTIDFAFGANFNQKHYFETPIYEPLASHLPENKLPKSTSLLKYAPNRLHQGRQGSCVGWACSYVAHTVLYAAANRRSPNSVAFSPAFCFNQIAGPNCEGAYLTDALTILRDVGNLPIRHFNYDKQTCQIVPTSKELQQARRFRIGGFYRLTQGASLRPNLQAIRQHLAAGVPVVAGVQVGGTFLHQMQNRSMWIPTQQDYKKNDFFGHAMAIVGYDDELYGGAFQLVNSWGWEWGKSGTTWVTYRDFLHFVEEVYSFFPEDTQSKKDRKRLVGKIQLVEGGTNHRLKMRASADGIFKIMEPTDAIQALELMVENQTASFVYVLAERENDESEVVFPHSKIHSAYCGIRGTRAFSLKKLSTNMAVIFSKRALNWENVNNLINASRQATFSEKLKEVLALEEVEEVSFRDGKSIRFQAKLAGRNTVTVIIKKEE